MKANAPEKIYIVIDPIWGSMSVNYNRNDINNIEYIRKDAFIEKTCEWLKENKDKYLYNTGEKGEYIPTCSGKMIDEFIKFMKGE